MTERCAPCIPRHVGLQLLHLGTAAHGFLGAIPDRWQVRLVWATGEGRQGEQLPGQNAAMEQKMLLERHGNLYRRGGGGSVLRHCVCLSVVPARLSNVHCEPPVLWDDNKTHHECTSCLGVSVIRPVRREKGQMATIYIGFCASLARHRAKHQQRWRCGGDLAPPETVSEV